MVLYWCTVEKRSTWDGFPRVDPISTISTTMREGRKKGTNKPNINKLDSSQLINHSPPPKFTISSLPQPRCLQQSCRPLHQHSLKLEKKQKQKRKNENSFLPFNLQATIIYLLLIYLFFYFPNPDASSKAAALSTHTA